jgi:protein-tyrosine phosphatase
MRVLFVCLGNICRSPAAEGIFRAMVERAGLSGRFEIDSAGTYSGHEGELPDQRMRNAAAARGYNLASRSRPVRSGDFDRFDMIVAMDDANYERLHRLAPTVEAAARIRRMTEFCRRTRATHIPDPYYEGIEGFERVLDLLEECCGGLLEEIK